MFSLFDIFVMFIYFLSIFIILRAWCMFRLRIRVLVNFLIKYGLVTHNGSRLTNQDVLGA